MISTDALNRTDKLFDGHYRLLRLLSSDGATSDVWLAADLNTIDINAIGSNDESSAMLVALKIYRPKNALDIEGEQRFRAEYMIAHECRHPNLLPPEGFSIYEGMPYLIIPYCEAGSAEQFIGKAQTTENVWKFISDVSAGLDRLHTNHPIIIHQDIKPANILIDSNHNYAITDFGISSKTSNGSNNYDENNGTLAYMAPERFDKKSTPIPQSDIWAFGATLCEILTGQMPFGEEGGLAQKKQDVIKPSLSHLPVGIRDLITACLQLDPAKRPTAHQIMESARNKGASKKRIGLIAIISLSVLVLFGIVNYFINKSETQHKKYTYEQVEAFLLSKETCAKGLHLLDSLVSQNDYQATYLLSRLYFSSTDTRFAVFHEDKWSYIIHNCEISQNNKKAHELLYKAFTLDDSDPMMLSQLGLEYHAGRSITGWERNSNYALWCYDAAENALASKGVPYYDRFLSIIKEQKELILSQPFEDHTPIKPVNP